MPAPGTWNSTLPFWRIRRAPEAESNGWQVMSTKTDQAVICRADIERRSGFEIVSHPGIRPLRSGFFRRLDLAVAGDAPKDFLRVYQYGRGRKAHPGTWPAYIAKVGSKHYPNQSVTEHLLTRIGQTLGLAIASSCLMWVREQLRFLGEYFLREDESLIHGAEIFAGCIAEDSEFLRQVEEMDMAKEIFTLQVVETAVRSRFPAQADAILQDFARLLAFDAVVGNNDRHFFNWGVITHVSGARPTRLAPAFDTARALFWNTDEAVLATFDRKHELDRFLDRYVLQCYPKTAWEGIKSPNHFELVRKIVEERPSYREAMARLNTTDLPEKVQALLDGEFDGLVSARRKRFIVSCIRKRLAHYNEAVTI